MRDLLFTLYMPYIFYELLAQKILEIHVFVLYNVCKYIQMRRSRHKLET